MSARSKTFIIDHGISYAYLHEVLRNQLLLTIPLKCTQCGSTKKVELANVMNHNYTTDISDYTFLCARCHRIHDGHFNKLKQGKDAILNYNPNATHKICTRCLIDQLSSEYYKDATYCKTCCRQMKRDERKIKGGSRFTLWADIERGLKICSGCGEEKPVSDFPKNGKNIRTHCRICDRAIRNHSGKILRDKRKLTSRMVQEPG